MVPVSVPLLGALDVPFARFWDVAAFPLLIGMVFAKTGCLLHGCCCGRPAKGWFALYAPDHRGSTMASGAALPYPLNPNGSVSNIAGLSDPTGRVLGLMPHPERFLHATQHPQWTRLRLQGDGAGIQLFHNAVAYYA